MSLTQENKQEIMENYRVHETDTGSPEVQVAILSEKISRLSLHLRTNKKDYASRRGLMLMIGRRKRLLSYIQSKDASKYTALIQRLGIRG
jgi:small subunit ribosomal protein S15